MDNRRSFVRSLFGGAAGFAMQDVMPARGAAAEDAWLADIAGRKHRAFLDVPSFSLDGTPFRRANALISTLLDSYGATNADIGVAFGVHGSALGYMLGGNVWRELGVARYIAAQPHTAGGARIVASPDDASAVGAAGVKALRQRGVHVLACRNSLARWTRELAQANRMSEADVSGKLTGGLHEGVVIVPAMITAAVIAQNRGIGYVLVP